MKFLILLLLSASSLSRAQNDHQHDDACEAAKHLCEAECNGNFKWSCVHSSDGSVKKSCSCTTGESGICGDKKHECRTRCGGAYLYQCKSNNDDITSRFCYCGSGDINPCAEREQQCRKQCGKMRRYECDGADMVFDQKGCPCAGHLCKASTATAFFCVLLLLKQLF